LPEKVLGKGSGKPFSLKRVFPRKKFLFFVFAVEFFEVFVVNEGLLACRAEDVFGIYGIVEVDLAAAVRAHCKIEFFVVIVFVIAAAVTVVAVVFVAVTAAAIAVTVIVVAIAVTVTAVAVAVVIVVDFVNDFFHCAEVFVDFFDICAAVVNLFGESFDFVRHLGSKFRESSDYLAFGSRQIEIRTVDQTLDISTVFLRVHSFSPLWNK
jgi:hypothetical protein